MPAYGCVDAFINNSCSCSIPLHAMALEQRNIVLSPNHAHESEQEFSSCCFSQNPSSADNDLCDEYEADGYDNAESASGYDYPFENFTPHNDAALPYNPPPLTTLGNGVASDGCHANISTPMFDQQLSNNDVHPTFGFSSILPAESALPTPKSIPNWSGHTCTSPSGAPALNLGSLNHTTTSWVPPSTYPPPRWCGLPQPDYFQPPPQYGYGYASGTPRPQYGYGYASYASPPQYGYGYASPPQYGYGYASPPQYGYGYGLTGPYASYAPPSYVPGVMNMVSSGSVAPYRFADAGPQESCARQVPYEYGLTNCAPHEVSYGYGSVLPTGCDSYYHVPTAPLQTPHVANSSHDRSNNAVSYPLHVQNISNHVSKTQHHESQKLDIQTEEASSKDINIGGADDEINTNSFACKWLIKSVNYMSNLLIEGIETGDIKGQNVEILQSVIEALFLCLSMQPSADGSTTQSDEDFSKIDRNIQNFKDILKLQCFMLQSALKKNMRVLSKHKNMLREARIELVLLLNVLLEAQCCLASTPENTGVVKEQGDYGNSSSLSSPSCVWDMEEQKPLKYNEDDEVEISEKTSDGSLTNDIIEDLSIAMKQCFVERVEEEDDAQELGTCPEGSKVESQNAEDIAIDHSTLLDGEVNGVAHKVEDGTSHHAGKLKHPMEATTLRVVNVDGWEYVK
ncbi:hypothetical protein GOP47_0000524 [Adiantum capillus-veneris]|uniref:Uncharacterized protein n=1 Tax=Adiantum capillus-veneris TaxID=13818 RepID=A0A9D4ZT59_ADICA|nr:hypothetical protein GOP47_0000524 [Adiantum capillus-veneris]